MLQWVILCYNKFMLGYIGTYATTIGHITLQWVKLDILHDIRFTWDHIGYNRLELLLLGMRYIGACWDTIVYIDLH